MISTKPGELLVVVTARGRRIVRVEHETKTQIKTKDGTKWNKKTGRQVGIGGRSAWDHEHIGMPLEGELEEIQLNFRYMHVLNELKDYIGQLRKAQPSGELLNELIQVKARLAALDAQP